MKLASKTSNVNTPLKKKKNKKRSLPVFHAASADDVVLSLKPVYPLYMIWPEKLKTAAHQFTQQFPGDVMYAVKCNPAPDVIRTLYQNGINAFDAASIEEVKIVRRAAPRAKIYFMHPVKSPEAIRSAYYKYGVRAFVLDTQEELYKILRETDLASDLELFVRLALPKNDSAQIDFASKFGAPEDEAINLLRESRAVAADLGLCFHVGTQTMDPSTYARAIDQAAKVIKNSGVQIETIDIGGGFPVAYPGQTPPPLSEYMAHIKTALAASGLDKLNVLCEPGRALVASAGALVVRVEQRRGDLLYLNDGTYGGLFDAGAQLQTRYPVQRICENQIGTQSHSSEFRFAGPTCDSLDMMPGPFMLPADIKTGDWIRIDNMGAYSHGLRSNFNGFGTSNTVHIIEHNIFTGAI